MSRAVIVIGAGGHAKVVIDALRLRGDAMLGVVDADPARHGGTVLGIPVIGGDAAVLEHAPADVLLANGIGSAPDTGPRRRLFEAFKDKGYVFATVVHPSAVIAADVAIGEGAQVMAGAVVQAGTRLGADAIVNTRASVDHDCTIGAHCHVAPGATLSGGVVLGDAVHVGAGAVLIQGVAVGAGSVVGAGAVVLADLPAAVTAAGNPARVVP